MLGLVRGARCKDVVLQLLAELCHRAGRERIRRPGVVGPTVCGTEAGIIGSSKVGGEHPELTGVDQRWHVIMNNWRAWSARFPHEE